MIGKLLIQLLSINLSTKVSDSITTSGGDPVQVWKDRLPQGNDADGIVWHKLDMRPVYVKGQAPKMDEYTVRVTVWNKEHLEAQHIADQVRTILEGWQGNGPDASTWVETLLTDERDQYNDDQTLAGVVQTWSLSQNR